MTQLNIVILLFDLIACIFLCLCGRFRLHVIDLDPSSVTSGGWLEDTSLVEKYKISEEAYNKREGMFSILFPPVLNLKFMHYAYIWKYVFNELLALNLFIR